MALLRTSLLGLVLAATSLLPPVAHADPSSEYSVKAAFLLNFARLAEWPGDAFPDADAPLVLGVLGDEAYASAQEAGIERQRVGKRRVELVRLASAEDAQSCHLVFVSVARRDLTGEVLSLLDGRRVLTVGEWDGFAHEGGTINFYLEDRRVRFEINAARARTSGVRISSRLMRLARIVKEERP